MISRKTFVTALLALAGMAIGADAATAQGAKPETAKFAIGTAKDPNLGAQIVIARDKGLFKEEGLDVDVKFFPSGGDLLTAIVSGDVLYGSSGSTPITTLRGRPFPIKIVAQISDISGAQQLVVKKSINKPEDLAGKKVGLLKATASELLWESFLAAHKPDRSTIQVVNMGPTEMLTAFVRGDVDAVALWEPHSTRARVGGNGHILVSGTTNYIGGTPKPQRIYGDHAALFATESVLAQNPQTTRAVLRALLRANDVIASNRAEATRILAKEFGLEPEVMSGIMDVNDYTLKLDKTLVADMNRLADFLQAQGRLPTKLDARAWIDPSALKDVRASLVALD